MILVFLCSYSGCKVESVYLGVDSVNTHRDRPEVGIPGSTQKCLSADDVDNLNPLQGWFTSLRPTHLWPGAQSQGRLSVNTLPVEAVCDFLWWFLESFPSHLVCISLLEQAWSGPVFLLHRECKCFRHSRGSRVQSPSTSEPWQQPRQLWHHLPCTCLPPSCRQSFLTFSLISFLSLSGSRNGRHHAVFLLLGLFLQWPWKLNAT